jgi:hypothetical protein
VIDRIDGELDQHAKADPQVKLLPGIAKRRGKKIATVAIARKLLTRAWHLLNDMQAAAAATPLRRP